MAHHPEKFLDGHMLWRGRIYSPLPFVRSLWGTKINAGVWGTAAFPSVYRSRRPPVRVSAALDHVAGRSRSCWRCAGVASPATGSHRWAAALLLGDRRRRHRRDDREEPVVRVPVGRRLAAGQPSPVPARRRRLPALPPAARAHARPHPRRAVAARSRPAAGASPQTSRGPATVAARGLARAAAAVRQRHRRSLLERDVDIGRARARASSPTGSGGRARCATIEIDEGWSRRSRRERARRAVGLARPARARRGPRRGQGPAARQHAPATDDASASSQRGRARDGAPGRRAVAGVALRWPLAGATRRRCWSCSSPAFTAWRTAQATAIVRRGVQRRRPRRRA